MNLNRSRCTPLPFRLGFTLVEVMVALILISILGAMTMTAVRGVTQNARLARTRSIIAVIDSVIEEQYEGYKYRPLSVEVPDLSRNLPAGVFGYELLPSEAARVRLNMLRDLQRMELPDRISDLSAVTSDGTKVLFGVTPGFPPAPELNQPLSITAIANPVVQMRVQDPSNPSQLIDVIRRNPNVRNQMPVNWFGARMPISPANTQRYTKNLPTRFAGYVSRITQGWTVKHQGAECLYLIVASSFVGGSSAIDSIPSTNIGDTDSDGMLEILDGWGTPIEFVRWPCGYHLADSQSVIDLNLPDDFDLFRSDFGFLPNLNYPKPWSLKPLIISAGPDRESGLHLVPRLASDAEVHFRYNTLSEPASAYTNMAWRVEDMGPETPGRTNPYFFIDPYIRNANRFGVATLPGSPKPGEQAFLDDNISNYALAAE